ncbi:MAG: hypothetical protein ACOCUN_03140 [Jiangellaceae bacterium]
MSEQPRQSATAESAKSITDAGQHEDFPGQLLVTRRHGVIREWARARRAEPVMYRGSEGRDRVPEVSLLLPGDRRSDELATVPWERWLDTFTLADLRFIYREHTPEGELSTYFRLDRSSREE